MNRSSSQIIDRSVALPSHPIARTRGDDHGPSAGLSVLVLWTQQVLRIADGQPHLTIPGHGVRPVAWALFTVVQWHRLGPQAGLLSDNPMASSDVVADAISGLEQRHRPLSRRREGGIGFGRGFCRRCGASLCAVRRFLEKYRSLRKPAGIREGALQQMANGTSASDAIKQAVGIQPFEHIRLQPHLNRSCLGISAGLKTAAGIAALGSWTGQGSSKGFTPLGPTKPSRSRHPS